MTTNISTLKLDATDVIRRSAGNLTVTLQLTGVRWWQFRLRLGLALVKLGLIITALPATISLKGKR